jgi:hypothetical protein
MSFIKAGNFNALFGDPAPGVPKTFQIVLSDGTQKAIEEWKAGSINLTASKA